MVSHTDDNCKVGRSEREGESKLGKYMYMRVTGLSLENYFTLWAHNVHCQTKRNENEGSWQAKLVKCKVFGREVTRAGITTNHHLDHPSIAEYMSYDGVAHLHICVEPAY